MVKNHVTVITMMCLYIGIIHNGELLEEFKSFSLGANQKLAPYFFIQRFFIHIFLGGFGNGNL
jgi:hypothetical protein